MEPTTTRPILITGATGFVGGYLIREFIGRGIPAQAIVAVAQNDHIFAETGRTVSLDIRDRDTVFSLMKETQPSAIVHLAAIAEPARARSEPSLAWSVNVDGTRHLAEAVMMASPDTRFVFAGSSESYGASFNDHMQAGGLPEDTPLKPINAYAATKAVCDVMLSQMSLDGLRCIRFRAFNHSGPGQTPAYVLPAFAEQVARIEAGHQEPVLSVGNLDAERDFLDVRDVVKAYAMATLTDAPAHDVFNLSSGRVKPVRYLLDRLVDLCTVPVDMRSDPDRMRASEVPLAVGNNTRLRAAFGWEPAYAFDQTIADTLEFWRAEVRR